ncbi:MAG TPA: hypothetical protein VMY36_00480 [Patescibacteria group bacterium]|nr:hypothetical protein [Patescibacteria group bacterium]
MTEEERFNPEEGKVSKEETADLASSITNLEKPEMTEAGKERGWERIERAIRKKFGR